MSDRLSDENKDCIFVSKEILNSSNIIVEELQHHLIELKAILREKFEWVVPTQIYDLSTLQWIVDLSLRLHKLRNCEGFDRHIQVYTKGQVKSSYFVTVISSYLIDKVDSIILEPPINGKNKMSDILVNFQGKQVYLECKCIETEKFDYSQEHEHMFSILRKYVNVPHQISIRYKNSLSDTEIHQLGETLHKRVQLVTGGGRIINNADLEVQVMKREMYGNNQFSIVMTIFMQDLPENCIYPGHVYYKDGISMSVSGPKVDYSKVLKEKFKRSKRQSPDDQPYILVIDGNKMLGNLTENIRAISSSFQPNINTRFSGALLVKYERQVDNQNLNFSFNFISNPFARFPISKKFENLFQYHRGKGENCT